MTQTLAKFHNRHPRYTLQAEDNTLIRVAGPHQTPWEEATEIQNISLTGLAFTSPPDLCPVMGEMIKVQFHVPGASQTACFGWVARLEKISSSSVLVGVEFKNLEIAHKVILAQGLNRKIKQQESLINNLTFSTFLRYVKDRPREVLVGSILILSWATLCYVLAAIFDKT